MAQAVLLRPNMDVNNILHQQALLTRPEVSRMTKLDQELATILSRSDLTPDAKMRLYYKLFSQYRNLKNNVVENGVYLQQPALSSGTMDIDNTPSAILQATKDQEGFHIQPILEFLTKAVSKHIKTKKSTKKRNPALVKRKPVIDVTATPKKTPPHLPYLHPNKAKHKELRNIFMVNTTEDAENYITSAGDKIPKVLANRTLTALTTRKSLDNLPEDIKDIAKKIVSDTADNLSLTEFVQFPLFRDTYNTLLTDQPPPAQNTRKAGRQRNKTNQSPLPSQTTQTTTEKKLQLNQPEITQQKRNIKTNTKYGGFNKDTAKLGYFIDHKKWSNAMLS